MFSAINRKVKRWVLRQQKRRPMVFISDTTVRDGAQMPGIRLDAEQKTAIVTALAKAGVHSIDLGFPAAGEHEVRAIRQAAQTVKGPVMSVLARTKIEDVDLAADVLSGLSPLKRGITLFIGTSPLHRRHKHDMTKAQIVRKAVEAIQHAQSAFEIISFGAEDASRTEPEFLHEIYHEAIQAGAISIGYTDTVGILTPTKAADAVRRIQDNVACMDDALLAVHFHNDLGLATANSLACVSAGANIVQGTINGIGERAGNAAIEEVVLALTLNKDEYGKDVTVNPRALCALSQLVAKLTGVEPAVNKPVIGRNIFRTEAGIHQHGVLAEPATYLPFPPETIGAESVQILLGHNSGRAGVRHHVEATGSALNEEHVGLVLDYLKGNRHAADETPEVQAFLEKIRPFMTERESRPEKAAQNVGDTL